MNVFEVFGLVAGYATAGSKLLETLKPYWGKLPAKLAAVIPSLLVVLPAVAVRLGGLHTTSDLKALGLAGLALLLPGVVPAEKPAA